MIDFEKEKRKAMLNNLLVTQRVLTNYRAMNKGIRPEMEDLLVSVPREEYEVLVDLAIEKLRNEQIFRAMESSE